MPPLVPFLMCVQPKVADNQKVLQVAAKMVTQFLNITTKLLFSYTLAKNYIFFIDECRTNGINNFVITQHIGVLNTDGF